MSRVSCRDTQRRYKRVPASSFQSHQVKVCCAILKTKSSQHKINALSHIIVQSQKFTYLSKLLKRYSSNNYNYRISFRMEQFEQRGSLILVLDKVNYNYFSNARRQDNWTIIIVNRLWKNIELNFNLRSGNSLFTTATPNQRKRKSEEQMRLPGNKREKKGDEEYYCGLSIGWKFSVKIDLES